MEKARRDAGLTPVPGVKPIFFGSPQEFYDWLEEHHETDSEVYVGLLQAETGKRAMSWSEAVDQALCWGWIDGALEQHRRGALHAALHPAAARQQLEQDQRGEGREAHRGRADAARPGSRRSRSGSARGRASTPSSARTPQLPPEYEERLRANSAAAEYFDSRPPWYRRTAIHLIMSAKREETRLRRLAQLIEDSAAGLDIKQLRR